MRTATAVFPTLGALDRPALRLVPKSFAVLFAAATLLAASACLSPVLASPARGDDWRVSDRSIRDLDTWADGRLVDVQLRVDGEAAPLYLQPGRDDRHYFQAFAGRNYSIVLRNNTGRRIAVLLAVDGLNVVNGEISRLRSNEAMYVLSPWESATIKGWRTSLDEVRRFVFVDEQRSYAERTGQANSDMGWIRVLSFREQLPWWQNGSKYRDDGRTREKSRGDGSNTWLPYEGDSKTQAPEAAPAPGKAGAPEMRSQAAPEAQDNLARGEQPEGSFPGTGWGDRKQDHVDRVRFNPEPVAVDQLIFRYEYASGLRALGIIPWRGPRERLAERDGGFARPPRW